MLYVLKVGIHIYKYIEFQLVMILNPAGYVVIISSCTIMSSIRFCSVFYGCVLPCSSHNDHYNLSSSSVFLMTSTLASSGEPFILTYTVQFAVHVLWIFLFL